MIDAAGFVKKMLKNLSYLHSKFIDVPNYKHTITLTTLLTNDSLFIAGSN